MLFEVLIILCTWTLQYLKAKTVVPYNLQFWYLQDILGTYPPSPRITKAIYFSISAKMLEVSIIF